MITIAAVMMIKMTDKDEHRIMIKTSFDVQCTSSTTELLALNEDFLNVKDGVLWTSGDEPFIFVMLDRK